MLEKIINSFNFEEKEAKVYLASLELGNAKVSEIAKKCGLNRITVYEILKRLRSRGYAFSLTKNNIITFRVVDPDKLMKKMEEKLALSKDFLPALLMLKNNGRQRPKIEYFDGVEGLRSLYEATLNSKEKNIYRIASPKNAIGVIGKDFFKNYVKKRSTNSIRVKVLLPKTLDNKVYLSDAKIVSREVKFIDTAIYPITNEIFLFDNKVALLSFSSKIGVLIEDEEIAKSMKSIWKFMWHYGETSF
ncbi:MAG: helix-turn-helix domain-containing protein [Candidatus Buchananbacteria bacterium]